MKHINKIEVNKPQTKSSGKFLDAMFVETSKGLTENMAVTYTRSGSSLLDFFAQGGAMRNDPDQALELFKKAFSEDREKAIKILFYLRDIRGGQGERQLFRNCITWLGETYPEIFESIVNYIPEYGRWDDMFFDNAKCFSLIKSQLEIDKETDKPSLLAKWLPTINASSIKTKTKARFMAEKLELPEPTYRKTLRDLREKIKIVEKKMSAQKWGEIDYSSVPSQAARIYKNAFQRNDEERYNEFIERAEEGKEKIQAKTLYPYQIYKTAQEDYSRTLEALWNQLPDYTQGKNALVVADVSGSMYGDPIAVSVSLALYFAERNKGQFQNHFITFSGEPTLQKIQGSNLKDKMNSIESAEWDMNTDLQRVFDLILRTGIDNNVSESEMPETIYIISDMEFDEACNPMTNFEVIEEKYKEAGYKRPNLVFWNVNASGRNLPVLKDQEKVSLVSGFSPVIFKMVVENKTPEQVMEDTINSKRYSQIRCN